MTQPVPVLLRLPGQEDLAFCFPGLPTDLFPDQQVWAVHMRGRRQVH